MGSIMMGLRHELTPGHFLNFPFSFFLSSFLSLYLFLFLSFFLLSYIHSIVILLFLFFFIRPSKVDILIVKYFPIPLLAPCLSRFTQGHWKQVATSSVVHWNQHSVVRPIGR